MDFIQKELSVEEFSATRNGSDSIFSIASFSGKHLFCGNFEPKPGILRIFMETKCIEDNLRLQKWQLRLEQIAPDLSYWYQILPISILFHFDFLTF